MPAFTAFPNAMYDPHIQYISQSILVESTDTWAELEVVTPGVILDEPDTTTILLTVEVADTEAGPFQQVFGALMSGMDGETPGKPGNPRFRSLIDEYIGKWVRATMLMTNAGDSKLRIRVDGRTYN